MGATGSDDDRGTAAPTLLEDHVPDLASLLDALDPDAVVRSLVDDLAERHRVAPDRQSDYVSLRPGGGGPIAVYVHRGLVSIALPPPTAAAKAVHVPGAALNPKTPATTYLEVPSASIAAARGSVMTLCGEALVWRSTMADTRGREAAGHAVDHPVCAVCGTQHPGEC